MMNNFRFLFASPYAFIYTVNYIALKYVICPFPVASWFLYTILGTTISLIDQTLPFWLLDRPE